MPAIIAKLLVSVVVMLSGPAVFVTLLIVFNEWMGMRGPSALPPASLLALLVSSSAWLLLWHREVRWTPGRTGATLIAGGAAVVAGLVVGSMIAAAMRWGEMEMGTMFGCMTAYLVWLGGTPFAWRETMRERGERLRTGGVAGGRDAVRCPTCGYSMAGLREAKCPECGAAYTIDQLVAAVVEGRDGVRG